MEKHFCTCKKTQCPNHPNNRGQGCDLCIQKNLGCGEIPACFWFNIANVSGVTEYSVDNFVKYYFEHKRQADKKDSL
jgi:hypothetical protein